MEMSNKVFIATSMDGFIADRNGGLDWLYSVPNPDGLDMGYSDFISGMDAIVMGRNTFETVCSFDCEWPYNIPVFVLSRTQHAIPEVYKHKAQLVDGNLRDIVQQINKKGYKHLYIDGGKTIQGFLKEDMIDELIVSTIPVLLGGGTPLFGATSGALNFELVSSQVYLNAVSQVHYRRKR